MGTPEFPNLGKHCTKEDCKLIDFLPFTCDLCHQVFCLEHRSYGRHSCPNADKKDITVVICPLCAKGVRLDADHDPNISWETHVNTDCDPSNYDKVTKKKKCPVRGCREVLSFSNTIKCRDCAIDHCLKHRFGPDHSCPGLKKPESSFQFLSLLNRTTNEGPKPTNQNVPAVASSAKWATAFRNVASSVRASASKLSTEINQAWQTTTTTKSGVGPSGDSGGAEECPQCGARFAVVTALVEHVEKVHERSGNQSRVLKLPMEVCPKCSKGFRDPIALVEHVERDHAGSSKA